MTVEITFFEKDHGPLSKRIFLSPDGKIVSDGAACVMASGAAQRLTLEGVDDLAKLIETMQSHEALALGRLRDGLPDAVEILPKSRVNGAAAPHVVARTAESVSYLPQAHALCLLDYDRKGMPDVVAAHLEELGGFEPAIASIVPEIASAGRLIRASTSAGLYNADTGKRLPASGGLHAYLLVKDGSDIERFLRALHDRCWLAGLGWFLISASGQLLERSIVDRLVGAPERLVFEGAPVLDPPLAQDREPRQPIVYTGGELDTAATCPPLNAAENARLGELRARTAVALEDECRRVRERWIETQIEWLVERTGSAAAARRIIEAQIGGTLLPDIDLEFDDPALGSKTIAAVLADPDKYIGETLADPIEGVAYGRGKAKVYRRRDGSLFIGSLAHGLQTNYEVKADFAMALAMLEAAAPEEVEALFIELALTAHLGEVETEKLRNCAAERIGAGKRTLNAALNAAKKERQKRRAKEERQRRAAERQDNRPQIPAPPADAPYLPVMAALNDVLGAVTDPEPPMRDIEDAVTQVRVRRVPKMHALTALGANQEEDADTRLPPPEQPLLTRLDDMETAELFERYIDFSDETGRSVHLTGNFVKHYLVRHNDPALPRVSAIATTPVVLVDGTLLAGQGLDRERGIVFRIAPELLAVLPRREDCTDKAVAEAMRFLTDEWLCDVATSYPEKCILVACALTIIERALLTERPAFWVVAGRRGGGKTTTISMLHAAVTGVRPSASAWSKDAEERRKALLAYLLEGLPCICWDNIPKGAAISCAHIEKALTAEFLSDRVLGVSKTVATSAATVQVFTANNAKPVGDLASRSLTARLSIDRVDPENRDFTHPDPIAWTEANRGTILYALYVVLLGNPLLGTKPATLKTRFKGWWRLVGSAVEHAASLANPETEVDFQQLFLTQEEGDEEAAGLAEMLQLLAGRWPNGERFKSGELADLMNDPETPIDMLNVRQHLFEKAKKDDKVSAKAVGKRLSRQVENPARYDGKTLILRSETDRLGVLWFHIDVGD
jgi:hypothetical protein